MLGVAAGLCSPWRRQMAKVVAGPSNTGGRAHGAGPEQQAEQGANEALSRALTSRLRQREVSVRMAAAAWPFVFYKLRAGSLVLDGGGGCGLEGDDSSEKLVF